MDIIKIKQEPKEVMESFMPSENVRGDPPLLEHSKEKDLFKVGLLFFEIIDGGVARGARPPLH